MKVSVLKHGRLLQFVTTIPLGKKGIKVEVYRELKCAQPGETAQDGLDAFMRQLGGSGDVDDCFAALEGDTKADPQAELQAQTKAGLVDLKEAVRARLDKICQRGKEAEQLLQADINFDEPQLLQPPDDDHGICSICHKVFKLHYIGGTTDLCMNHVPEDFT